MALGLKKTLLSNSKVNRIGQKSVLSLLWEPLHPIDKTVLSTGVRTALLCSASWFRKENRSEQMILLLTLAGSRVSSIQFINSPHLFPFVYPLYFKAEKVITQPQT